MRRRGWLTPRALPRPAGGDEPHPGPELDRDGDPHRLRAGRRAAASSSLASRFILPGLPHRPRLRLGLRALRHAARGGGAAARRQARDHRDRRAGALESGAGRGPDARPRRHRPAFPGRGGGRRPRAHGHLRRGHARGPSRVGTAGKRLAAGERPPGHAAWRGRPRLDGDGGGTVRPHVPLPRLPEGRLGPLRQRLRAPRLPARRPRRAERMAHRGPASRRGRGRAGHAGARVHHRDVRRLRAGRASGARWWRQWVSSSPPSSSWPSAGPSSRGSEGRPWRAPSSTG